jgi:acyl-coenzyme A synthetase/AMP-(fatty) acid ligase
MLEQPDKLITDVAGAGVSGGRTSDEKVPRAWIVLSREGKSKGSQEVVAAMEKWTQDNLSKYKWLRGGIEVVKVIPKNPTGKVLRRVLQEKYEEGIKKQGKAKL